MTLDQHSEFANLVGITASNLRILPGLVLKDYWVTRILRALATDADLCRCVIFKGGTSLSKGWQLIDRFSEDVDLLTAGPEFAVPPGKKDREKLFKAIKRRVEEQTPLRLPELRELPIDEREFFYVRGDYHLRVTPKSPSNDYVFLEMGFRGGTYPHDSVNLNSFVAETVLALPDEERDALLSYKDDFEAFSMELLSPVRTFVEKLLALHCDLEKGIEHVRTRHYYDIHALFTKSPEVKSFVQSGEFPELVRSAVAITIKYFDKDLDPNLDISKSQALQLSHGQISRLSRQYANDRDLYFKGQPLFDTLVQTVAEIRSSLQTKQSLK
jgi:hypothetical protein